MSPYDLIKSLTTMCKKDTDLKSSAQLLPEKGEKRNGSQAISPSRDLLPEWIGSHGKWQFGTYFLFSLMVIVHAWQMLCMKFLSYPVDHWCARPDQYQNYSVEHWRNLSAPLQDSSGQFDKCNLFALDWTGPEIIESRPAENTSTVTCQVWEYDVSQFDETIVERWDLVCSKSFFPRLSQTVFFFGNMIGVFICGIVADRKGRKFTLYGSLGFAVLGGAISSLSDYFILWTVSRFLVGACTLSLNTCIAVYIVENSSAQFRAYFHALTNSLFWAIGHMLLSPLVYLIPNMNTLEWVITACFALFLPSYFIVPESPRWLLTKGKVAEAQATISKISSINKTTDFQPEDVYNYKQDATNKEQGSLKDILTNPGLRRNMLSMSFCWLSFSMAYFGLLYNTPSTSSSVYMVFFIPGLVSVVAIPLMPFMQSKFGRKATLTIPLITAGVFMLATLAVPKDQVIVMSVLSVIGTLNCAFGFDTGYLFTKELFPTVLRTTALSVASASARIGSILSPLIGGLDVFNPILPIVVYGGIVLVSGLQSILIWPETLGQTLPDTVEESEAMAQTQNSWTKSCKKSGGTKENLVADQDIPRDLS